VIGAVEARAPARPWWRRVRNSQAVTGYLFVLPLALPIFVFHYASMLFSLAISLTDWSGITPRPVFVGLGNYVGLVQDPTFWNALYNTVYYTAGTVPLSVAVSIALAIVLNQGVRGLAVLRAAYFLPYVTPTVAVAVVWLWLYAPGTGLFNQLLRLVGLPPQQWLLSTELAMPAMIVMGSWKALGAKIVILLAGLQGIPRQCYEAARIDGAGDWACARYITLPLLMPTIFLVIVLSTINSFQVFGSIYVMTQGGPLRSTEVMVYYIFNQAFESFRMGYASALSWVLFAIILGATLLQKRLIRSSY
jgi:multiple sugar transport system permease protein